VECLCRGRRCRRLEPHPDLGRAALCPSAFSDRRPLGWLLYAWTARSSARATYVTSAPPTHHEYARLSGDRRAAAHKSGNELGAAWRPPASSRRHTRTHRDFAANSDMRSADPTGGTPARPTRRRRRHPTQADRDALATTISLPRPTLSRRPRMPRHGSARSTAWRHVAGQRQSHLKRSAVTGPRGPPPLCRPARAGPQPLQHEQRPPRHTEPWRMCRSAPHPTSHRALSEHIQRRPASPPRGFLTARGPSASKRSRASSPPLLATKLRDQPPMGLAQAHDNSPLGVQPHSEPRHAARLGMQRDQPPHEIRPQQAVAACSSAPNRPAPCLARRARDPRSPPSTVTARHRRQ
jgi:hypothetical protein